MGDVVPLIPERVELPPRPAPRGFARPFPWPWLAPLLLPAAALGGAAALARWLDAPPGDAVTRWLWAATGIGALLGAVAALALSRRALGRAAWLAWAAVAPWAVANAVPPAVSAVGSAIEVGCRVGGRPVCSLDEFGRRCRAAARGDARALLGAPAQVLCAAGGCTERFLFRQPLAPDAICSVVVGERSALLITGESAAGRR